MGLENNQKIDEYLSSLCSQIRNSKVHSDVREEVRIHIEEIAQEYTEGGFTVDEAVNKAIAQMGDASLIGKELNKVHKQRPEWSIVILTSIFAIIGLSTIFIMGSSGLLTQYSMVTRSVTSTLIGVACAALLYYFDYMKIKGYSIYIYFGTVAVAMYTIFFCPTVNGRAYLFIGIGIDFIAISPFLFTTALAGILENFNWRETKNAIYGSFQLAFPALLMILGRSLSAMVAYSLAVLVLLIISGVRVRNIFILVASCIAAFWMYILKEPFHIKRLLIFLYPEKDPTGSGYLNIQLNKLVHSAGLFGQGFAFNGRLLPNIHSDFIFTYIIYTFGWIAGILIAVLVILFLVRISHIAIYVKSSYGKLLICGFVAIFSVQFLWNILMNLNLAPIATMGLPFISYGNSQFVVNMAVIGLISNIYKQRTTAVGNIV
ncbi:FtsW/RodA/SpoVE family cell cycle protein [Candidatus Clostridium radicumherbarum]|uniref:FtsW/RodA/SpoVE family cell cycle protein n=1 Tax=Candidatus Clostridium radicumherbarum TaxID=3381662 RepID=A0ABW8TR30_9CLOT